MRVTVVIKSPCKTLKQYIHTAGNVQHAGCLYPLAPEGVTNYGAIFVNSDKSVE